MVLKFNTKTSWLSACYDLMVMGAQFEAKEPKGPELDLFWIITLTGGH